MTEEIMNLEADKRRMRAALLLAEPHLEFLLARNPQNQYVAAALIDLKAALTATECESGS